MLTHNGTQTIETERLILRKFEYSDCESVFKNWASDEKVQMMYSEPTYSTLEETKGLLDKYIGGYQREDYYRWAVIDKENGECIGQIAYFLVDNKNHFAEIGHNRSSALSGEGASEILRKRIGSHEVRNPLPARLSLVRQPKQTEKRGVAFPYRTVLVACEKRIGRNVEGVGLVAKRIHVRATALDVANREYEVAGVQQVDAGDRHFASDLAAVLRHTVRVHHNMAIALKPLPDAEDDVLLEPRNEHGHVLVDDLVAFAPEVLHCARIDLKDVPVRIGYDDGVIHTRQELAEERSAVFWYEHCHLGCELYQIRR